MEKGKEWLNQSVERIRKMADAISDEGIERLNDNLREFLEEITGILIAEGSGGIKKEDFVFELETSVDSEFPCTLAETTVWLALKDGLSKKDILSNSMLADIAGVNSDTVMENVRVMRPIFRKCLAVTPWEIEWKVFETVLGFVFSKLENNTKFLDKQDEIERKIFACGKGKKWSEAVRMIQEGEVHVELASSTWNERFLEEWDSLKGDLPKSFNGRLKEVKSHSEGIWSISVLTPNGKEVEHSVNWEIMKNDPSGSARRIAEEFESARSFSKKLSETLTKRLSELSDLGFDSDFKGVVAVDWNNFTLQEGMRVSALSKEARRELDIGLTKTSLEECWETLFNGALCWRLEETAPNELAGVLTAVSEKAEFERDTSKAKKLSRRKL